MEESLGWIKNPRELIWTRKPYKDETGEGIIQLASYQTQSLGVMEMIKNLHEGYLKAYIYDLDLEEMESHLRYLYVKNIIVLDSLEDELEKMANFKKTELELIASGQDL